MTAPSVTPLRYITTPTLKEIYEGDMEGFEAVVEEPMMESIAKEAETVAGNERYYSYMQYIRKISNPDLDAIVGQEGFLGGIKKVMVSLYQTVRDFFKWIWGFFASKEKKIDYKLNQFNHKLKERGVSKEPRNYPSATPYIYPKAGAPAKDLGWMKDLNKNIAKGVTNLSDYAKKLTAYLNSLSGLTSGSDHVGKLAQAKRDFDNDVRTIFGVKGKDKGTLIIPNDFHYDDGLIKYIPHGNDRKMFKNATFTSTETQIDDLRAETKGNLKNLKDLTTDLQKLEDNLLKVINTVINKHEKMDSAIGREINLSIRSAMGNIRNVEFTLYKALLTSTDIYTAALA